ncbi:protein POLLEN DEFECTIVE IN GUIDANCE 1 isoform X2 [Vigna angularis]|uniref:protein POLLEN DEFECTIVE IN GUIDANCE 1 isoform X2 n=1 Tax=Phaseolus angularis TaxID=3914 RepID=UPI0022B5BEA2|nr:protein POLLEN DEFECTIVE IN GUIDANCE 1 isoform X2 [Vigna angularis]
MALRNGSRKISFEVLSVDGESESNEHSRRKRRHRASKRKKKLLDRADSVDPHIEPLENGGACNGFELDANRYSAGGGSVVYEEVREASVCAVVDAREAESEAPTAVRGGIEGFNFGKLRQRNVSCGSSDEFPTSVVRDEKEEGGVNASPVEKPTNEPDRNVATKLETVESLDWKRLMEEDPNYVFSVEKSPVTYFLEEMYNGNSLRSTTTLGNEKERERVYDTIFRLPWRCELAVQEAINNGNFRFWMFSHYDLWSGSFATNRQNISLIYHMIRGQGTIKLYVVYNVLEIFDKLCQSFNGDVLQTLFLSAEGLANCPQESIRFWIWRFVSDQALAVVASIVHSFILLAQAITLSTCIVAHNNALLALLVSNNFAEIKSNVFKRYSMDNVHSLVYFDSVERFHISSFILFVLAQNILEAEGPWFQSFLINILLVYVCEMVIDIIKHSFIAKFNDIKPIAYSEFLEDLCKQTLNMQTEGAKKNLTFVPLAPACVVIRVLTPVYSANLPNNPLPWRLFWILLFSAMTYVMLTSLKLLIGIGLHQHATWYVNRCRRRKHHFHED